MDKKSEARVIAFCEALRISIAALDRADKRQIEVQYQLQVTGCAARSMSIVQRSYDIWEEESVLANSIESCSNEILDLIRDTFSSLNQVIGRSSPPSEITSETWVLKRFPSRQEYQTKTLLRASRILREHLRHSSTRLPHPCPIL